MRVRSRRQVRAHSTPTHCCASSSERAKPVSPASPDVRQEERHARRRATTPRRWRSRSNSASRPQAPRPRRRKASHTRWSGRPRRRNTRSTSPAPRARDQARRRDGETAHPPADGRRAGTAECPPIIRSWMWAVWANTYGQNAKMTAAVAAAAPIASQPPREQPREHDRRGEREQHHCVVRDERVARRCQPGMASVPAPMLASEKASACVDADRRCWRRRDRRGWW